MFLGTQVQLKTLTVYCSSMYPRGMHSSKKFFTSINLFLTGRQELHLLPMGKKFVLFREAASDANTVHKYLS